MSCSDPEKGLSQPDIQKEDPDPPRAETEPEREPEPDLDPDLVSANRRERGRQLGGLKRDL